MIGPFKHLFQAFRYSETKKFSGSSLSYVNYNGDLYMYGMEDEQRDVKVAGETRIPAKVYKLCIQERITPKTIDYRNKYDWFDRHIMFEDVDNFDDVYIHIGNWEKNTDACFLAGNRPNNNVLEYGEVAESRVTFKRFYEFVFPLLLAGEDVYFELIDRDR